MNSSDRSTSPGHRLAALLVLAHLFAVVALAASPRLHHWVHPDDGDDDHDCAVVLFMHGGCGQAALPVVVLVCPHPWQEVSLVVPPPLWVAGVFAVSGVLEHAPPWVALRAGTLPSW